MNARTGKCPQCKRPTVPEYRPFCSKRCSDIDLARWLTGSYVIAGGNSDADDDSDRPGLSTAQEDEDRPSDD